jgi:hypothetical protein
MVRAALAAKACERRILQPLLEWVSGKTIAALRLGLMLVVLGANYHKV